MNVVWKRMFMEDDSLNPIWVEIVAPPAVDVGLVSYTTEAYQIMVKSARTYKGADQHAPISDDEIQQTIKDLGATKLKTALEQIHFCFFIENVTRAFTHQLVRYRIGTSFTQESMRFYGAKGTYRVLVTGKAKNISGNLEEYGNACFQQIRAYHNLVQRGVASEDARGLLPTNILTYIIFDTSLLGLGNIINQRMCCQAQHPEWLPCILAMRKHVQGIYGESIMGLLKAPVERGVPCGFNASFDRKCTWKTGITVTEIPSASLAASNSE